MTLNSRKLLVSNNMIAVVYQLSVLGPGPGALPELPLAAPITGSIRLSPLPAGAGARAAAVVGPSSGPVLSSRHGESFAGKIYEESICRQTCKRWLMMVDNDVQQL